MDTPDEQADQLAALVEAALPDPELTGLELPPDAGFIVTKEHRRFAEFAAAVRRDRYIGLCYGSPGVGKTASARRYACWHELEPLLRAPGLHFTEGRDRADWHTLLYTPTVSATPRTIDKELTQLGWDLTTILTPYPRPSPAFTSGNYRLVQRLFAQIQRIMEINNLSTITREVVETARESLVMAACRRHVTPENLRHKALKVTGTPSQRSPTPAHYLR